MGTLFNSLPYAHVNRYYSVERNEYVNVAFNASPVPEGSDILKRDQSVNDCEVTFIVDSPSEEIDEDDTDDDSPGSVYCNISNFTLPEGGGPISDLPNIIDKVRRQPGGFEAEYKVDIKTWSANLHSSVSISEAKQMLLSQIYCCNFWNLCIFCFFK